MYKRLIIGLLLALCSGAGIFGLYLLKKMKEQEEQDKLLDELEKEFGPLVKNAVNQRKLDDIYKEINQVLSEPADSKCDWPRFDIGLKFDPDRLLG